MYVLSVGAIAFDQALTLALTWSDLKRSNRGQAHFKHISESCNLETLADRAMVTITVE